MSFVCLRWCLLNSHMRHLSDTPPLFLSHRRHLLYVCIGPTSLILFILITHVLYWNIICLQKTDFIVAIKCITKKNLAKSQNLLSKEIKILKVYFVSSYYCTPPLYEWIEEILLVWFCHPYAASAVSNTHTFSWY